MDIRISIKQLITWSPKIAKLMQVLDFVSWTFTCKTKQVKESEFEFVSSVNKLIAHTASTLATLYISPMFSGTNHLR